MPKVMLTTKNDKAGVMQHRFRLMSTACLAIVAWGWLAPGLCHADPAPISVWDAVSAGTTGGIAVDDTGNVYVAGSGGTVKYNSSGLPVWAPAVPFDANASAVAVDALGNVYVTGVSSSNGIRTVKYGPDGSVVWNEVFDSGNALDSASAIAVDGPGNVYVTGFVNNGGTDSDIRTIKYDSSGNVVWNRQYDGGGDDEGRGIAVDGSQNVYVAGFSRTCTGCTEDYRTIMYDSNGTEKWNVTYDNGDDDDAYGIALDGTGNVYVTGGSFVGTDYNYLTVKYLAPTGAFVTATVYGRGFGDDVAFAVTVDGAGDVYVTGRSLNGSFNYDYLTFKYGSALSSTLWTLTYDSFGSDEAKGIVADASGNVYVAGDALGGNFTIKYVSSQNDADIPGDAGGSFATGRMIDPGSYSGLLGGWDTDDYYRFSVPLGGDNVSFTLTSPFGFLFEMLGPGGDVMSPLSTAVAFTTTISGTWAARCRALGSSGYYSFTLGPDPVSAGVLNIAPDEVLTPVQAWAVAYDSGGQDRGAAVALVTFATTLFSESAGEGTVYVAGTSDSGTDDYRTIAYSSNGAILWTVPYDGGGDDVAADILAIEDDSGVLRVMVVGSSYNGLNTDYRVVIYDEAGDLDRDMTFDSGRDDYASAMAFDPNATGLELYVTGSSSNKFDTDFRTVALDFGTDDGFAPTIYWNEVYDSGYDDVAVDIAVVDAAGSNRVYVVGFSRTCTGCSTADYRTIMYDSTGNIMWNVTYDGGGDDVASGIAVDGEGNVYVTGTSSNDYRTIKYNSSGSLVWNVTYDGGGNDTATDIVLDMDGNLYVTGQDSNGNFRTIKYDATGQELLTLTYANSSGFADYAMAITIDDAGTFYVTGYSSNGGNDDFRTVKYGPGGFQAAVPPSIADAGTAGQNATLTPILGAGKRIQLVLPDNGVVDTGAGQDAAIQIRPNAAGTAHVDIYSMAGKRILSLSALQVTAEATYVIRWNGKDDSLQDVSSGVYLMRVKAPGIDKVVKIVIVR